MKALDFTGRDGALSVLCIGAHSDDIEIGAGGTILRLITEGIRVQVHWCVLSAPGARAEEALASAEAFLRGATEHRIDIGAFEDGDFPDQRRAIKLWLSDVRNRILPDIIFTHTADDRHQDHREVCELTWNLFRNQTILEYEIPKWDGDLGRPNAYIPLTEEVMDRKTELLHAHFGSQRAKDWFDEETFRGLARLRGMECRSPGRYAEAFVMRKARLL